MAERYDGSPTPKKVAQRRTYAWEQWSDGSQWRLTRGEDYDSTASVRVSGLVWGRARGLAFHYRQPDTDHLIVWFTAQ